MTLRALGVVVKARTEEKFPDALLTCIRPAPLSPSPFDQGVASIGLLGRSETSLLIVGCEWTDARLPQIAAALRASPSILFDAVLSGSSKPSKQTHLDIPIVVRGPAIAVATDLVASFAPAGGKTLLA